VVGRFAPLLRRRRQLSDLVPLLKSLAHDLAVVPSGETVPPRTEVVAYRAQRLQGALRLAPSSCTPPDRSGETRPFPHFEGIGLGQPALAVGDNSGAADVRFGPNWTEHAEPGGVNWTTPGGVASEPPP